MSLIREKLICLRFGPTGLYLEWIELIII